MIESILCPKPDNVKWYLKDYLFGTCVNCGVEYLPICPIEEDGGSNSFEKWKHFAMETIITRKGEEKKKLQLIYEETTLEKLISYLKPKVQAFVRHTFVAKWEDK